MIKILGHAVSLVKRSGRTKNVDVYWDKSENIEADYYTKYFTARYHRNKQPTHVLDGHVKSKATCED